MDLGYNERQKIKEIIKKYLGVSKIESDSALVNAERINLSLKDYLEISEEYIQNEVLSRIPKKEYKKIIKTEPYKKLEEQFKKLEKENSGLLKKLTKKNRRI